MTNARSVFPKLDELSVLASVLKVNVIIVTESWLHEGIMDDLLRVQDLELFRCDRKYQKGGGVCIWSDSKLLPVMLLPLSALPSIIECIFIRFSCVAFSIICCGIYVPPGLCKDAHVKISDFLIFELDQFLCKFPNDRIVLAGDFNDFSTSFLIENFGLSDYVTDATMNDTILHHIFIDDRLSDSYLNCATTGPPLKNSDHNIVLLRPITPMLSVEDEHYTLVWDFRKSNVLEFLRLLELTDFTEMDKEASVDDMCFKFYELLSHSLSAIPRDYVRFSEKDKPWMTPILKSLINKRWDAFRSKNWTLYTHYKKKVKNEISNAKRIWSERQSQSPRGLWNVVRHIKGSRQKEPWRKLLTEAGGFQELLTTLTDELCKNFNSDDDVQLYSLSTVEWTFRVSPDAVYHQLSQLSNRKATGPDMLPPTLLKAGAQFLSVPLANFFNRSIQTRTYPMFFKQAHVCPIPKCRNPRFGDFRPISLLPCISKVFERLVLQSVAPQLYQCFGSNQHAYRPLCSTTTALIAICEHITRELDVKKTSHVNLFCLDLSKAFDKLQHHRLINYLSARGLDHGFLSWLLSYLQHRSFCVKICNRLGPVVEIHSGVPQGSVLGPFLFAAFMGSLTFSGPHVYCVKYADDVTLIEPVYSDMTSSISLDDCISLFHSAGLFVNSAKCKQVCIFRPRSDARACVTGFEVVKRVRILGFYFTDTFKWNAQISDILRQASQRLHIIRLLKTYGVSVQELIRVYHAIITSLFMYASPAYGQLPATLLAKLEKFQNRGHRLICGDSSCSCGGFPILLQKLEAAASSCWILEVSCVKQKKMPSTHYMDLCQNVCQLHRS